MDIYTLLTTGLLVLFFAIAVVVTIALYISGRRERAEAARLPKANASAAPVVAAPVASGSFFDGVEGSSNIILEASRERPRRGEGYGETKEADQFDL